MFGCYKKIYLKIKKDLLQSFFCYDYKSEIDHKTIFGGNNYWSNFVLSDRKK